MSSSAQSDVKKEEKPAEPLKVLIADDDPPTRILLRAAIAKWGYEAEMAGDGEEAWALLQKPDAPRLLILDWIMPKLDGIGLCSRIRSNLSTHPYIILLTQVAGVTNIIAGLEAGADEFLSKPFNMAELRSRLTVGARIIQNENMLAQQNTQLQVHVRQMQTIAEMVKKALDSKENMNPGRAEELEKILQHIHEAINSFPQTS